MIIRMVLAGFTNGGLVMRRKREDISFMKFQSKSTVANLLNPQSIAIIGASEKVGSLGRTLVHNMLGAGFEGRIYPIHPKNATILGLAAYPSVLHIQEKIDLAVIVTPSSTVPSILEECGKKGISTVVVISSGFKEIGEEGEQLEKRLLSIAKHFGIRILGPNCLGVMNPHIGLNATFAKGSALKGHIAFISQSGALCTAILDWSLQKNIGFSAFVSMGSMSDIDWTDMLEYLEKDALTKAIVIYMETIGSGQKFMEIAKKVILHKPICIIKAGRTQAAAQAAISHTGSLSGGDDVFTAAMEQIGVLRVDAIEDLMDFILFLAQEKFPKGNALAIVTNAGGPGVLATDAAALSGAHLAQLDPSTIAHLNAVLPPSWSHNNPIDVLGDADVRRYEKAIEHALLDKNVHGLLVILTPQDMTDAQGTANSLATFTKSTKKPLFASWMGGASVASGIEILESAHIPCFAYPDRAAVLFSKLAVHQNYVTLLAGQKSGKHSLPSAVKQAIEDKIAPYLQEHSTVLSETLSKEVLELAQIPIVKNQIASSAEEACVYARNMGFPVVLKLHSLSITHKSDLGGVKLNLKDERAVVEAFQDIERSLQSHGKAKDFAGVAVQKMVETKGTELILGSSKDLSFGPTILFGAGGEFTEILKDRSLGIPPLDLFSARRMIEKTRVFSILQGARSRPAIDLEELTSLLLHFSLLIHEIPSIIECDINPLLASKAGLIALDARIVLRRACG